MLFDDFGDCHRPNVTTCLALYNVLESVLSINLVCDLASFDRHMNSSPLPRFTKLIRSEQSNHVRTVLALCLKMVQWVTQ